MVCYFWPMQSNLLKRVLFVLAMFVLSILLLVKYLSTGNLEEDTYYQLKTYHQEPAAMDSTLEVMTYNIGYLSGMINNQSVKREPTFFDHNLQSAKALVSGFEPHVIGFQEIDFSSDRSFSVNQLDTLAFHGHYQSGYASINWDKKYVPFPYWPISNHFGRMLSGQAILAKGAMKGIETIKLKENEKTPAYYQAFYLDRLLQVAEVAFWGQKVIIMNVHLEAYDKDTRLEQIREVKAVYERYCDQQPVILLGDFNSEVPFRSEDGDAIELLMESEWITSAIPFDLESENGTYPSEKPDRMIDYIFYNQNFLECDSSRMLSEAGQISDHLPVWGRFHFN